MMFNTRTERTTNATSLTGICRINIFNTNTSSLCFILNKALKFCPCPAMQAGTNPFTSFNAFADIGQVLQYNRVASRLQSFCDNGFTYFVVNMGNMAGFSTRDFAKQLFCALRAVALKPAAKGKMLITFVSKLTTTKKLSGGYGGQVVLSKINSDSTAISGFKRSIRQIQNEIKIPNFVLTNKISFFYCSIIKIFSLKISEYHFNTNATGQRIKGKSFILNGKRAGIKMNTGSCFKRNGRNIFCSFGFQCFISICNGLYCNANHLRTKFRLCSDFIINNVMQGHAVPAASFTDKRDNQITCPVIFGLQVRKSLRLLLCSL